MSNKLRVRYIGIYWISVSVYLYNNNTSKKEKILSRYGSITYIMIGEVILELKCTRYKNERQ